MRSLQPANRVRVGVLAIAVVVLVVGVGQSFSSLPMLFAAATYYADPVLRAAGLDGSVGGVERFLESAAAIEDVGLGVEVAIFVRSAGQGTLDQGDDVIQAAVRRTDLLVLLPRLSHGGHAFA